MYSIRLYMWIRWAIHVVCMTVGPHSITGERTRRYSLCSADPAALRSFWGSETTSSAAGFASETSLFSSCSPPIVSSSSSSPPRPPEASEPNRDTTVETAEEMHQAMVSYRLCWAERKEISMVGVDRGWRGDGEKKIAICQQTGQSQLHPANNTLPPASQTQTLPRFSHPLETRLQPLCL